MMSGSVTAHPPSTVFSPSVRARRPVPTSSASLSENEAGKVVPAIFSSIWRDWARADRDGSEEGLGFRDAADADGKVGLSDG